MKQKIAVREIENFEHASKARDSGYLIEAVIISDGMLDRSLELLLMNELEKIVGDPEKSFRAFTLFSEEFSLDGRKIARLLKRSGRINGSLFKRIDNFKTKRGAAAHSTYWKVYGGDNDEDILSSGIVFGKKKKWLSKPELSELFDEGKSLVREIEKLG